MKNVLAFLLLPLAFAAEAAVPPALVWSPTDHSEFIAVSGSGAERLTLFGSPWTLARSDTSQSTGIRVIQAVVAQIGAGVQIGFANGAASPNDYAGSDNNSISYWSNGNVVKGGGWALTGIDPYTTGDTVGMTVDFAAHTVKFQKNGGAWSATVDITSLGADVYVAFAGASAPGPGGAVRIVSDNWNDALPATLNVIAHGDSITLGGGALQPYISRLVALIRANRGDSARGYRFGINGVTWNFSWSEAGYPYSLIQDALLRVVPALSPSIPNWVILFAGTNGDAIFHDTAAAQYAALQAEIGLILAAGVPANHIIVNTMLPRGGGSEAYRMAYNAAIVADAGHIGYLVARLDLDPYMGGAGAYSNSAYFQGDQVHPTDAAHQRIAQLDYWVMFPKGVHHYPDSSEQEGVVVPLLEGRDQKR
jgi:lysophospholipase L1-like esterase